jgi:hypothetical protein
MSVRQKPGIATGKGRAGDTGDEEVIAALVCLLSG